MKKKIPNLKSQTPNKSQAPNSKSQGASALFGFEIWNLFEIWDLDFGISFNRHSETALWT
jgi:hypothetical protein